MSDKRDAAWQAYFTEQELQNRGYNSMVVASIRSGFEAGWAARNSAVDYVIEGTVREPRRRRPWGTIS